MENLYLNRLKRRNSVMSLSWGHYSPQSSFVSWSIFLALCSFVSARDKFDSSFLSLSRLPFSYTHFTHTHTHTHTHASCSRPLEKVNAGSEARKRKEDHNVQEKQDGGANVELRYKKRCWCYSTHFFIFQYLLKYIVLPSTKPEISINKWKTGSHFIRKSISTVLAADTQQTVDFLYLALIFSVFVRFYALKPK